VSLDLANMYPTIFLKSHVDAIRLSVQDHMCEYIHKCRLCAKVWLGLFAKWKKADPLFNLF